MRRAIFLLSALAVALNIGGPPATASERSDCLEGFGGGDWQTAIPACTRVLASKKVTHADRARIFTMRGHWYGAAEKYDLAIADYREAQRINPTKESHLSMAQAYESKGDLAKAIAEMDDYVGYYPDDVDGFHARANMHARQRSYDKAIADMNEKIRLGARTDAEYMLRASFWRHKGDNARAIADYSEAIRLAPKDQSAHEQRARAYEATGDTRQALADFRKALALDPQTGRSMGIDKHIDRLERDIASGFQVAPKAVAAAPEAHGKEQTAVLPAIAERRVALVVGNSAYANTGRLSNPKNDAELIAGTLRRSGFTQVELRLDLTRNELLDALKSFAAQADKADWAVIYYAGHGLEIGGQNYVVPTDAKLASDRDIPYEAIALDHVLHAVEGTRKLRVVVLDACRDNPFVKTMTRSTTATRSIGRGLAQVEPESATLVAYAAKHGQVAQDGDGANSPFALSLARNIEAVGIEINLLLRKVRDDVLAATGKRQEPFIYGSLPSEAFYFRTK